MPSPSDYAIGIISLGCAKNLVDTEHMSARLSAAGYRFTSDISAAGILWVNTCAFINDARRESIDAILEAASMKQHGACRFLLVTGCLTQRYRAELPDSLPEVDAFLGLDQLDEIVNVLANWREGKHDRRHPSLPTAAERLYNPPPKRPVLTGGPYAYVKISEGCNHRCAFCAIPGIRGKARSRSVASIRAETETLLESGIREINLVAQDSTAYGRDRKDDANLSKLLRELGHIGGDFWMRILYGYPTFVTTELLQTMAETPQVCRYLDVPIQHRDPGVLTKMGRAGTIKAVAQLASRARAIMPDITLRTTCLVGHPGESRTAFENLRQFLADTQFDHLGVFVYSPEEGTRSLKTKPGVSITTAQRRRDHLLREQQGRVAQRLEKLIGQTDRILVETTVTGRSAGQAPEVDGVTRLRGAPAAAAGRMVDARYQAFDGYDLTATIL